MKYYVYKKDELVAFVQNYETLLALMKAFYPEYDFVHGSRVDLSPVFAGYVDLVPKSVTAEIDGRIGIDGSFVPNTTSEIVDGRYYKRYTAAGQGSYESKERYPRGWDPRYDY